MPLVEQAEAWLVGAGPVASPIRSWQVAVPQFDLAADDFAALLAVAAGQPLWVRQIGSHALSPPLLLELLA